MTLSQSNNSPSTLNFHLSVFESLSDAVIATDLDYHIIGWNTAAETLYGWTAQEAIGRAAPELIPTKFPHHGPPDWQHDVHAHNIWRGRIRQQCKHQHWHDVDCSVSGVRDTSQNLIGYVCINRNITHQVQAEHEREKLLQQLKQTANNLRQSEARYRQVVETSNDLITLVNLEGNFLYLSPSCERIIGYTQAELLGHNAFPLAHPDDLATTQHEFLKALQGEQAHATFRYRHKAGHWIVLEGYGRAISDDQGVPNLLIFTFHDITERIRLDQLKDEFLGIAGHELRTPLTSIKANVQIAKREIQRLVTQNTFSEIQLPKINAIHDALERAERQTARTTRLVKELLDISLISTGKLTLYKAPSDLYTVVEEAIMEQQQAHPHRIFSLSTHTSLLEPLLIDADRISQVVTNYLTNAIKYSPPDRPITVSITVSTQEVTVAVQDEGPGIAQDVQDTIWERFYRAPSTQTSNNTGGNLGLGLYICRSTIEQHQGQVGVNSTAGQGSTFWFTLPLISEMNAD